MDKVPQDSMINSWREIFGYVRYVHEMERTPSIELYAQGLRKIQSRLSIRQKEIFQFLYGSYGHAAAASDMKEIHYHHATINGDLYRMAMDFCKALEIRPIFRNDDEHRSNGFTLMRWNFTEKYSKEDWDAHESDAIRHWAVWSNGFNDVRGKFMWVLHDNVALALEDLSWVISGEEKKNIIAEKSSISEPLEFSEGGMKQLRLSRYERSPIARRMCIGKFGYVCQVCFVLLESVYGKQAAELIHVHHKIPLSNEYGNRMTDPMRDLVTVCPNCHAVIHSRVPEFSIDEVRQMLADQSRRSS